MGSSGEDYPQIPLLGEFLIEEDDKMKKYFLVLVAVSFLITAIVSATINPILGIGGGLNNILIALEFVFVAWILYEPIKRRF